MQIKSILYWCVFDIPNKEIELAALEKQSEDPDLWNDVERAQTVMKNLASLRDEVNEWRSLEQRIKDAIELAEFGDESLLQDLEQETSALETEINQREFFAMLSGPYDRGDALLAIHAGAGGTDSQDWAEMLER
ncbi:PCRF domain-containing protein, partial [candidate division WWE3 bacterium]|nr:PCRF domain-containing protein [candidate division WWE3 bacterium]